MDEETKNSAYRKKLKSQLIEAHGRIVYTYTAHHKMVDHFVWFDKVIRITQIVLTAISTGGFLSSILTSNTKFSWIGGIPAALSLALNIYSKDFKLQYDIGLHKDAADLLWDVREKYNSLITDFEILSNDEIRTKRNELQENISQINKKYPGTDRRSYKKTQKALKKEEEQTFNEGEAEKFLYSELMDVKKE